MTLRSDPEVIDTVREYLASYGITRDEGHLRSVAWHIRSIEKWERVPPPFPDHGAIGDCAACDARRMLRADDLNAYTQPKRGTQHG